MTALKIKSPWTMVWSEYIDDFISNKENLALRARSEISGSAI